MIGLWFLIHFWRDALRADRKHVICADPVQTFDVFKSGVKTEFLRKILNCNGLIMETFQLK